MKWLLIALRVLNIYWVYGIFFEVFWIFTYYNMTILLCWLNCIIQIKLWIDKLNNYETKCVDSDWLKLSRIFIIEILINIFENINMIDY